MLMDNKLMLMGELLSIYYIIHLMIYDTRTDYHSMICYDVWFRWQVYNPRDYESSARDDVGDHEVARQRAVAQLGGNVVNRQTFRHVIPRLERQQS